MEVPGAAAVPHLRVQGVIGLNRLPIRFYLGGTFVCEIDTSFSEIVLEMKYEGSFS